MTEPVDGWTEDWGDTWTRTVLGPPGKSDLLLRVFPDPGDTEMPWTWEVLALDDQTEREIDVGGGASREAAVANAIAAAAGYVEEGG
jgi:hypothetical protein